jgi:Selenoprotein SelK_SelG
MWRHQTLTLFVWDASNFMTFSLSSLFSALSSPKSRSSRSSRDSGGLGGSGGSTGGSSDNVSTLFNCIYPHTFSWWRPSPFVRGRHTLLWWWCHYVAIDISVLLAMDDYIYTITQVWLGLRHQFHRLRPAFEWLDIRCQHFPWMPGLTERGLVVHFFRKKWTTKPLSVSSSWADKPQCRNQRCVYLRLLNSLIKRWQEERLPG